MKSTSFRYQTIKNPRCKIWTWGSS